MKLRRILGSVAIVGLVPAALFIPAASAAADRIEVVPISISEGDYSFEFSDERSGEPLKEIRSIGEDFGNGTSLSSTSDGVPVMLHTMAALADSVDFDAEYVASVEWTSTEREPLVGYDPENDGITEIVEITPEESTYDASALRPRAAYAVTPNSATFKLSHSQSYDKSTHNFYAVWVDDKFSELFFSPNFTITGLEPNSEYYFKIVASDEDPRLEVSETDGSLAITRSVRVTTPSSTLDETLNGPLATSGWTPSVHGYLHTTFIEDAMVPLAHPEASGCGAWLWETLHFAGDNRSYLTPTFPHPLAGGMPTNRTWMMVEAVWSMGFFTTEKHVSPTHKYLNSVFVGTDTATADNMLFKMPSLGGGYAQIILDHTAGNPWCVAGAIRYIDQVRFYQTSDTVEVVGWRYPVPNHEISFKYSLNAAPGYYWLPALWRTSMGFGCLTGYCPQDNYNQTIAGI